MIIIVPLIFLTLLKLYNILKNLFISMITVFFYTNLSIKLVLVFFIIIAMSIILIIIYIAILKICNIKILFNSNYYISLSPKKINVYKKKKTNISLEYLLILILLIIFILSIELFLLIYFFIDPFLSNFFYILIIFFLLYQIKLILQIIFLPIIINFYNLIILLKNLILTILPFFSMIYYISYFLIKYFLVFYKTISFINWIFILIISIFCFLLIQILLNNYLIKQIFIKIYSYKFRSYCIKLIMFIKNGIFLNYTNLLSFFCNYIKNNLKFKFKFKNINLKKCRDFISSNNFKIIKILIFMKNFISLIFKFNYFTDINFKNLFDLKIEFLKLIEDNDIITSSEEDNNNTQVNLPLNFYNFNNVLSMDKINYINKKMTNKGIDPNQPLTDWFISAALKNTNGTQLEVDAFVETNLNIILKNQREAQLNTHAFDRFKPFLIHRLNQEPNTFPSIIPISKIMSEYETQEIIDAFNKEKDIKELKEEIESYNKLETSSTMNNLENKTINYTSNSDNITKK